MDVVEHTHEDDPFYKFFRSRSATGRSHLSLAENFNNSVL